MKRSTSGHRPYISNSTGGGGGGGGGRGGGGGGGGRGRRYFNQRSNRTPPPTMSRYKGGWQQNHGGGPKRFEIDESDLLMDDDDSTSRARSSNSFHRGGGGGGGGGHRGNFTGYNNKNNNFRGGAAGGGGASRSRDLTFSHLSNSNRKPDPTFSHASQSIWQFFMQNCQSYDTFNKKVQLKDAIHQILRDLFPHIGVYIVGSSANGFGTNQSDVDICLMLTEHEIDQKVEAIQILRAFSRALKKAVFIRHIQVIHAKVPIIKFHDSHKNTHLLKAYSEQDWRVRPLVLTVKKWAKHHNINDASQATVSSYSLALMTIFYLQTVCQPPILPVLHDLYPEKFDINIPVDELKLNERLAPFTSQNTSSLGQLFYGFLDYYSNFNFEMNVISIRRGGLYARNSLPWDDTNSRYSQWKFILIEEPFDLSNTARSVHDEFIFDKIRNVFAESKRRFERTQSLESLFRQRFYDDPRFREYDDDDDDDDDHDRF